MPVLVGLAEIEMAGRDVDRAQPAREAAGLGARHVDMALFLALEPDFSAPSMNSATGSAPLAAWFHSR